MKPIVRPLIVSGLVAQIALVAYATITLAPEAFRDPVPIAAPAQMHAVDPTQAGH